MGIENALSAVIAVFLWKRYEIDPWLLGISLIEIVDADQTRSASMTLSG